MKMCRGQKDEENAGFYRRRIPDNDRQAAIPGNRCCFELCWVCSALIWCIMGKQVILVIHAWHWGQIFMGARNRESDLDLGSESGRVDDLSGESNPGRGFRGRVSWVLGIAGNIMISPAKTNNVCDLLNE
jgi:hypothetical protein